MDGLLWVRVLVWVFIYTTAAGEDNTQAGFKSGQKDKTQCVKDSQGSEIWPYPYGGRIYIKGFTLEGIEDNKSS